MEKRKRRKREVKNMKAPECQIAYKERERYSVMRAAAAAQWVQLLCSILNSSQDLKFLKTQWIIFHELQWRVCKGMHLTS